MSRTIVRATKKNHAALLDACECDACERNRDDLRGLTSLVASERSLREKAEAERDAWRATANANGRAAEAAESDAARLALALRRLVEAFDGGCWTACATALVDARRALSASPSTDAAKEASDDR